MNKQLLVLSFLMITSGFAVEEDGEMLNQPTALSDFGNITCLTVCSGLKPFPIIGGLVSAAVFIDRCCKPSSLPELIVPFTTAFGLLGVASIFASANDKCYKRISAENKGIGETGCGIASLMGWTTIMVVAQKNMQDNI
jgi:hypothetical protein